ncbi:hypothetical protein [Arthrobacter woluwensis]|uniref:hypothetical protein n=1 Tax=Arthrobacter woluwensis TaxID=156980 RepID=UPI00119F694F|nr:hypothetical protein [Arthrobacter woluwensis]
MKPFRFPQLLGRQEHHPNVPEHEQAAQCFIQGATELVNGMEQLAAAVSTTHPASARHLRLLAQQYASLAVTAVSSWPQAVRHDR